MGGNYTTKTHSEMMKLRWQDPEYRVKMAKVNSDRLKKKWQEPEYRERMLRIIKSPESIANLARAVQEAWTPERREWFGNWVSNRVRTDPEYAAKMRESARKANEASVLARKTRQYRYLEEMTKEEREYYDFLVKRKKYRKSEALQMLGNVRRANQSKAAAD